MSADPARLLLRALHGSAKAAGCTATFDIDGETTWASATFVGIRYRIAVTGEVVDAWLAALPDADLPLPGYFVASLKFACTSTGALLTVLVLEE